MLIPTEKINEAKAKYGERAIDEIVRHLGVEGSYDDRDKKCSCPWHRDKTPSLIWNSKDNCFHCFSCNRNYGIIDLYLEQGMTYLNAVQKLFEQVDIDYNFAEKGLTVKSDYKYPKHIKYDRSSVEHYLSLRKISKKVLDYADVQSDEHGNVVFHCYDENDVLKTVKYRLGRKFNKELDKTKCWHQPNADKSDVLFNMNRVDPTQPLVITEGECFKGDTEVLTPQGWVRLDLYIGQTVMQVNADLTGSFVRPLARIAKKYNGDMLYVKIGEHYIFDATENHNMVYMKHGYLEKKKACEMPLNMINSYIPNSIKYDGEGLELKNKEIKAFLLNDEIMTNDWFMQASLKQKKFILDKVLEDNIYCTNYDSNALIMQTLAHTYGYTASISINENDDKKYTVSIIKENPKIKLKSGFNKKYHYDGNVYCVSVPSGMILVRQEGHISVCGNCDCLSVLESGYSNVVSIIGGCHNMNWIEYNWDWLEQFNKIIVWFDNDEAGIKARNEVVYRLGTWRTYYVDVGKDELTPSGFQIKDINEVLYYKGKDKILEYINKPFEVPIDNVIDLSQAEDFDIESSEGLYTGIKDLDDKIYKLTFGTLNIITGKSGEGKSVFVNQVAICQALQQQYSVFVFSGELPPPILRNWVETNMIGRDNIVMKDNHIRVFDVEKRKSLQTWYKNKVYVYTDDYNTTANALLHKMEEMARKIGTKVFLIDNLMMVDLECSEEGRLQAEKDFVNKLIYFAKKFNVLVFLVAHPRKTGEIRVSKEDIAGSGNIVNLAHMVFSVHRYTDKEKEGETNRLGNYIKGKEPLEYDSCVEVLKNRITGVLPTIDLYFDYPSYRFYRTPQELWFRYGWDNRDIHKYPIRTDDPNNHYTSSNKKEESPFD